MDYTPTSAEAAFFYALAAEKLLARAANRVQLEQSSDNRDVVNVAISLRTSLLRARDVVSDGIEAAKEALV